MCFSKIIQVQLAQCEEQLSQFVIYKCCVFWWCFFFLQRVALVIGVLLSSKSLVCLLGCLLAFLRRVALHAVSSSKDYFVCGVAWLVGLLGLWRGDLLSLVFQFL